MARKHRSGERAYTIEYRRVLAKNKGNGLVIDGEYYPPVEGNEDDWRPPTRGHCTPRGICDNCGKLLRLQKCTDAACTNCGAPLETNRPCGYVSCPHNMWCDVNETTGSIKINMPGVKPWEVPPDCSCALDAAERGEQRSQTAEHLTLEEAGEQMNLTRERTRQIELRGMDKIRTRHPELRQLVS